jgi:hypothetical protein
MLFDYGRSKTLLVAVGVVALPLTFPLFSAKPVSPAKPAPKPASSDPRISRLRTFFSRLHCPVADMSEDFVRVADQNELDWRLLPSIAVVESGGGKAYKNNNIFGWNGGEQAFASIRSGLELVAYKLGRSPLYRRHDVPGKLHIYNENEDYASSVLNLMERIGPKQATRAGAALVHN